VYSRNRVAVAESASLCWLNFFEVIGFHENESEKCLRDFNGHKTNVVSLAFSKDGSMLASRSKDGIIKLWRVLPDYIGES
jgi:WD40 repeat protein